MCKLREDGLLIQLRNFSIGPIVGIFIGLITVPVTTRLLVPAELAKTSMFSLCQTIFYLVCLLGCDQAYVRFYSENKYSKNVLLGNSIFIPFIFCIFSILMIVIFRKYISIFLFNQYEPVLIGLIIISLPVFVINRFCEIKIRMDMRGKVYSFLLLIKQILNFLFLVFFLVFYDVSFKSIIYSSCFASFLYCGIAIICANFFSKEDCFHFDRQLVKDILKYGIPLVLASILTYVMNSFDKIALRIWSTFDEIGLYSASFKIVSIVNIFETIFTTAWIPVAYKWYEQNEPKEKFTRTSDFVICFMLLIFGLIIIFRKILLLFLGEAYRNTSEIFVFLLFSPVLYTISSATSLGIDFKKKSYYTTIVSAVVALINIVGNYLLVPKYGAVGAGMTTAFSYVVFLWLRTLISNKLWQAYPLWKILILTLILLLYGVNMLMYKSLGIELVLFSLSFLFAIIINWPLIKGLIEDRSE